MKEKEKIGPLKSTVNWDEYLNNEDFGPEPVRRQLKKILEHLNGLTYHDEVGFSLIRHLSDQFDHFALPNENFLQHIGRSLLSNFNAEAWRSALYLTIS